MYPFARAVAEQLGWDVRVVVPARQQSWVGKGYRVGRVTSGRYYVPAGPDGTEGELSDLPKVVEKGESAPWVLVDGTPGEDIDAGRRVPGSTLGGLLTRLRCTATCSNLALYSLFPPGSFDLVIAGPNVSPRASAVT